MFVPSDTMKCHRILNALSELSCCEILHDVLIYLFFIVVEIVYYPTRKQVNNFGNDAAAVIVIGYYVIK